MHRRIYALVLFLSIVLQIATLSTAKLDLNYISNQNAITGIKVLLGINIVITAIALQLLDIRRILVHQFNDSRPDEFHLLCITTLSIVLGLITTIVWWKYSVNDSTTHSPAFLMNSVSWIGLTLLVIIFKYSHLAL